LVEGTPVHVHKLMASKKRLQAIRATEQKGIDLKAPFTVFSEDELGRHDVAQTSEGFNVLYDSGSQAVIGVVHYRCVSVRDNCVSHLQQEKWMT
jgi:hypothetical protein